MRLFYERYVRYLSAVCARYVPDASAAKDILQESFLRIFGSVDSFEYRGEGCLKAWASRIVSNSALKWLQSRGRLRFMEELPEAADAPEEDLPVQKVPAGQLQRFIQELPDGYRTVFNLYVFEGKSHREIGQLLGIREDSSASQFFRARAVLAQKIKKYMKEHE